MSRTLRRAPRRARLLAGALLAVAAAACTPRTSIETAGVPVPGDVTIVAADRALGPVTAPTFREAREAGRARLEFFYVPAAGFAYRDAQGLLGGVTVELLRDFARYVEATHGIDVQMAWNEVPLWPAFYGYVRDSEGGVLGVGNVTITDERRRELDFSPPYLDNVAVLVTHERVPELASLEGIGEAFRGLTALSFTGTLHEARIAALRERHLPQAPVRPVTSDDELVSLVASDGEYFGYLDVSHFWRARQAGQPLRRHRVGDDASEAFGVILPRGSDWTPVIEAFFQAEGGYARGDRFRGHLRRHLGEELASLLTGG